MFELLPAIQIQLPLFPFSFIATARTSEIAKKYST